MITLQQLKNAPNFQETLRTLSNDDLERLQSQAELAPSSSREETITQLIQHLNSSEAKQEASDIAHLTGQIENLTLTERLTQPRIENEPEMNMPRTEKGFFRLDQKEEYMPVSITGVELACLPTTFTAQCFALLGEGYLQPLLSTLKTQDEKTLNKSGAISEIHTTMIQQFKQIFTDAKKRNIALHGKPYSLKYFTPLKLALMTETNDYDDLVNIFAQDALLQVLSTMLSGFNVQEGQSMFFSTAFMRMVTHNAVRHYVGDETTYEEIAELYGNVRPAGHHDVKGFSSVLGLKPAIYGPVTDSQTHSQAVGMEFKIDYPFQGEPIYLSYIDTKGGVGHFEWLSKVQRHTEFYGNLTSATCDVLIDALISQHKQRKKYFRQCREEIYSKTNPRTEITNHDLDEHRRALTEEDDITLYPNPGKHLVDGINITRLNFVYYTHIVEGKYIAVIKHLKLIRSLFSLVDITHHEACTLELKFDSQEEAGRFLNLFQDEDGLRYAGGQASIEHLTVKIPHADVEKLNGTVNLLYYALPVAPLQTKLEEIFEIGPYHSMLTLAKNLRPCIDNLSAKEQGTLTFGGVQCMYDNRSDKAKTFVAELKTVIARLGNNISQISVIQNAVNLLIEKKILFLAAKPIAVYDKPRLESGSVVHESVDINTLDSKMSGTVELFGQTYAFEPSEVTASLVNGLITLASKDEGFDTFQESLNTSISHGILIPVHGIRSEQSDSESDDEDLAKAIAMSMEDDSHTSTEPQASQSSSSRKRPAEEGPSEDSRKATKIIANSTPGRSEEPDADEEKPFEHTIYPVSEDATSYVEVKIFASASGHFRLIMRNYASGEQAKQEFFKGTWKQIENVKQHKISEYSKFIKEKLSLESENFNDAQKEVLANFGLDELTVARLMTKTNMSFDETVTMLFNDQKSSPQRPDDGPTVGSSGFFHHNTRRGNLQSDDAMDTTRDAPSKDDDDVDMEGNKP